MSGPPSPTEFIRRLHRVVRLAIPEGQPCPLHEPYLGAEEREAVDRCVASTFVSSVGPEVDRFERALEQITGAQRAVALVNGTAAIETALRLAGVESGDLVVCPSLTFVATANAIAATSASPAFVDVEDTTLGIDPQALYNFLGATTAVAGSRVHSSGARVSAIVLVHVFGLPAQAREIKEVCEQFGLPLIEDAAESLGSFSASRHTGRFGFAGALSFNGNKIVTTGGGGALLTDDPEVGARAKHITTTAKKPHRWAFEHDEIGCNYRLPNLNAALGCAQLDRLPQLLSSKERVHQSWKLAFEDLDGTSLFEPTSGSRTNYWLNALLLPTETTLAQRDELLNAANDQGIHCRPAWSPMHQLPMYRNAPRGSLIQTEVMVRRIICLPSSAQLDLM